MKIPRPPLPFINGSAGYYMRNYTCPLSGALLFLGVPCRFSVPQLLSQDTLVFGNEE